MREGLLDDLRALRDVLERRYNPNQPRDEDGRWTDGLPGLGPQTVQFASGATATVERRNGGPRLTIGGRAVELSDRERRRFRSMVMNAKYGDEASRSDDGVYRLRRATTGPAENLVSLRHVEGTYVTDDGRTVNSPEVDGHEVYDAEFEMVLNEDTNVSFDDEPSTRVTLDDLDDLEDELEAASREPTSRHVDTGLGEVGVFTPERGRIGLRVPTDDGDVDVEFDKADWKKVLQAIYDSTEHRDLRTADTAAGRIEVQTDNPNDLYINDQMMVFISSPGPPEWSIAAQGEGYRRLIQALMSNASAAGIAVRSNLAEQLGGAVDVTRYSPEQPRVEAGSASGGQFATADSGGKKKSSGSETLGYDPKTNRGSGYGIAGGDDRVKQLQEALNRLGLTDQSGKPLRVDGKLGPKTTAAIKKLQKQLGLKPDGQVTPELLKRILAMKGARPAAKTTPRNGKATLKQQSSRLTTRPKATLSDKGSAKLTTRGGLDMSTYDRTFPLDDIQIQRSGDGRTVEAYAAMFGSPYEVRDEHGHYLEVIDRAAFNRTLNGAGRNAMCLYNHGRNLEGKPDSMASIPLGSPLEIRPDARGLLTVTRYNKGPYTDQVLESIRNGDIKAQSFRGRIVRSSPNGRVPKPRYGQALPTVTRHELGLSDYGPTPIPVNNDAEIVAVRSVQDLMQELEELTFDEREELLRSLGLSTHDGDPTGDPDDEEELDEEDLDDDTATPDGSGPGAEDPPAERSATHSGRLAIVRARLRMEWTRRGVRRGEAA